MPYYTEGRLRPVLCDMKGVKIMAEFTNVAAQTVAANGNVVFSNTAVKGSNCIQHREGSGIITPERTDQPV